MNRRRFLQITLGASLIGQGARARDWQGRGFGADLSIRSLGTEVPDHLAAEIAAEITRLEGVFSLYQPSELTRLNAGARITGSADLRAVLGLAQQVQRATGGRFEPSIQQHWRDPDNFNDKITFTLQDIEIGDTIALRKTQSLTLNGIAQGYAADRIRALCHARGMRDLLVDMGEYAALGGPFRIGIADPQAGQVGQITLQSNGAVATSSPMAARLPDGRPHIIGPDGAAPLWSTVTVSAQSAALADAASTAFCLMTQEEIRHAATRLGLSNIWLVDASGDLSQINIA